MRKKIAVTIAALSAAIVLSSCSSQAAPTDFITPAPPAASETNKTSTDADNAQNKFSDATLIGSDAFGNPVSDPSAPFGLDTSNVILNEEVVSIFGEQETKNVVDTAMGFIETTSSLETRWKNKTQTLDDYRIAEVFLTQPAWEKVTQAVNANDQDSVASSLVPGKLPDNKLGDKEIPEGIIPQTLPPQDVQISSSVDEAKFGDDLPRVKVSANVYSRFVISDDKVIYGVRTVNLYFSPMPDGWQIDNWDATAMKEA